MPQELPVYLWSAQTPSPTCVHPFSSSTARCTCQYSHFNQVWLQTGLQPMQAAGHSPQAQQKLHRDIDSFHLSYFPSNQDICWTCLCPTNTNLSHRYLSICEILYLLLSSLISAEVKSPHDVLFICSLIPSHFGFL